MIAAILFDIGGPIDTESAGENFIDGAIRESFEEMGVAVDDESYAAAGKAAVECFAPNAYEAIIWRLAGRDRAAAEKAWRSVLNRARGAETFELRPGILELLTALSKRGLKLGLVANQPQGVIGHLRAEGLLDRFDYYEVSGDHGFRKPDPRIFLRACDGLGEDPASCVMIGDRIDNDIAPAKRLGMATILFRSGRHAAQQPRSWLEVPDAEVGDVKGLQDALWRIVGIGDAG